MNVYFAIGPTKFNANIETKINIASANFSSRNANSTTCNAKYSNADV